MPESRLCLSDWISLYLLLSSPLASERGLDEVRGGRPPLEQPQFEKRHCFLDATQNEKMRPAASEQGHDGQPV